MKHPNPKKGQLTIRKDRHYYFRGQIERGRDYRWTNGYSAQSKSGFMLFPWMSYRECQRDAKRDGYKAVFIRD